MANNKAGQSKFRRILPFGIAAVIVVAIASAIVLARSTGLTASTTLVPTFSVRQGPLTISVAESGTIKSQEQVIIKSQVEGQTTIIYLIPEGTRVSEGELLVELDASQLEDNRVDQQIRVQNAEAEFIRARENLAVVQNQAESDISKAELDYQFAQEDVAKYLEGEYPQQLREAESKITIAHEEKERASEKLKWSERLFKEKYISQTELDADRLTYKRAQLDHQLAVAAKDLLEDYTHKRQLAQLNSDVEQTRMALERARLAANADIVQAQADLKAKEAEFEQQQGKLAKIEEQLEKTKIYAPRDGLVVYATSTEFRRRGSSEPLEEGQAVRERQELIYLPSADTMMAELMIHESSLEKVRVGQRVRVTIDAMPGRAFRGHVASIAPLPDARSMWLNPDRKVYPTRVNLEGSNPELRTGMSCRAEIMIEKLSDATYVPIQAVVRHGGQPRVYVRAGDAFEPRLVEIGLDNNSMVHIASGLEAGEVVSLKPPLDTGTGPAQMPAEAEIAQAGEENAPAGSQPAAATETPGEGTPRVSERGRGRPPAGEVSQDDREARRQQFMNMSPEERRAAMEERLREMTPEQREQFMERMRQWRGRGGGASGDSGGGGRADRGGERP